MATIAEFVGNSISMQKLIPSMMQLAVHPTRQWPAWRFHSLFQLSTGLRSVTPAPHVAINVCHLVEKRINRLDIGLAVSRVRQGFEGGHPLSDGSAQIEEVGSYR